MTHDLEILRKLCLPLLGADAARDDSFWADLNVKLLWNEHADGPSTASMSAELEAQWTQLKAAYLYHMAAAHCAGHTNPTIEQLLQRADPQFMAEVDFQKDMLAAIRQVGRMTLKEELREAAAHSSADIADAEITTSFGALEREAERQALRTQLKQWDEEPPLPAEEPKRKRRITMPLLLLRVAAAAAVFTGAVVVVQLYRPGEQDAALAPGSNTAGNTNAVAPAAQAPAVVAMTDSSTEGTGEKPAKPPQRNSTPIAALTDTAATGAKDTAWQEATTITPAPARLPHIAVRGIIRETETGDTVHNVLVTLADDKGNKQTQLSGDGSFSFDLAPHRNYMILGSREHYRSVPAALSTQSIKDADTVITLTLHLAGDR